MGRIGALFDVAVVTACVVILGSLLVIVAAQVFFRYVLNASLTWSEEIARYLLIWLTFVGATVGIRRHAHIAVDIAVRALPAPARRVAALAALGCTAALLMILLAAGNQVVATIGGQAAPATQLPMRVPYLAIPVGAALMLVNVVRLAYEIVATGAVPSGHVETEGQ